MNNKYIDSPEYLFEEKFNDAELTGTIISFDRIASTGTGYMTVKNKKNDLYRICYNTERYDGAFKIGGTYHFIGCTTAYEETDKYMGSLRCDKLIDLNKPEKDQNEMFSILERMLKVLDKKDNWERTELIKYRRLPIDENTIQDDSILMEFINEFEGLWGNIATTIERIGKDRDVYLSVYLCEAELYDEVTDYLNYMSKILSDSFNSSAKSNYAKYEFEKQFGDTGRKGSKAIITNSLAYTLAFAVVCGISDTMDDIKREQNACNTWEQKQRVLINGLNRTWGSLYDSKVVPMIKEANEECVQIIKRDLFSYFDCSEAEYTKWLSTRVEKKRPIESMIEELDELIVKNRKIIEESGWLPFGQKARDRKQAENEIRYLEEEIKAVKRHADLDGKEIDIYNVTFSSFAQYDRLLKGEKVLKLVFNAYRQVYEIRTKIKNDLIGYTDRYFVCCYSRYRNLEAQPWGIENLTVLQDNVPDRFKVTLRIFDKE